MLGVLISLLFVSAPSDEPVLDSAAMGICDAPLHLIGQSGRRWIRDASLSRPFAYMETFSQEEAVRRIRDLMAPLSNTRLDWASLEKFLDPGISPEDWKEIFPARSKVEEIFGLEGEQLEDFLIELFEIFSHPMAHEAIHQYLSDEARQERQHDLQFLLEQVSPEGFNKLTLIDMLVNDRLRHLGTSASAAVHWFLLKSRPPVNPNLHRLGLDRRRTAFGVALKKLGASLQRALRSGFTKRWISWDYPYDVVADLVGHTYYVLRGVLINGNTYFPAATYKTIQDVLAIQGYSLFENQLPFVFGKDVFQAEQVASTLSEQREPTDAAKKKAFNVLALHLPELFQEQVVDKIRVKVAAAQFRGRMLSFTTEEGEQISISFVDFGLPHLREIERELKSRLAHETNEQKAQQIALDVFNGSKDLFEIYREALIEVVRNYIGVQRKTKRRIRFYIRENLRMAYTELLRSDRALSTPNIDRLVRENLADQSDRLIEQEPRYSKRILRAQILRELKRRRENAARVFAGVFIQAELLGGLYEINIDEDYREVYYQPRIHRFGNQILLQAEAGLFRQLPDRIDEDKKVKDSRQIEQERAALVRKLTKMFSTDVEAPGEIQSLAPDRANLLHDDFLIQLEAAGGPLKSIVSSVRKNGWKGLAWAAVVVVSLPIIFKLVDYGANKIDGYFHPESTVPASIAENRKLDIYDLVSPEQSPTEDDFRRNLELYLATVPYYGLSSDDISRIRKFFKEYEEHQFQSGDFSRIIEISDSEFFNELVSNLDILFGFGSSITNEDLARLQFLIEKMRAFENYQRQSRAAAVEKLQSGQD